MVVERQDSLLKSAVKSRNPAKALGGERTWSPVTTQGKLIYRWCEALPDDVHPIRGEVSLAGIDTVQEISRVTRSPGKYRFDGEAYEKEAINNPKHPWAGKIRYRPS